MNMSEDDHHTCEGSDLAIDLGSRSDYGQDLTELLDELFLEKMKKEIPDINSMKSIIESLPDNEYGNKYAKEISELYENRQVEHDELFQLEDYLARIYYKNEVERKLRGTIRRRKISRTVSDDVESAVATEILTEERKEDTLIDDVIGEEELSTLHSDIETSDIGGDDAEEEGPISIFGVESPIFTTKSDLLSIITAPTEREKFLLEKYAILFAEPLINDSNDSLQDTQTYPSNRVVDMRLDAAGSQVKESSVWTSKKVPSRKKDISRKPSCSDSKKVNVKQVTKTVFQAIPPNIVFTDCKPGVIYETALELRNVSTTAQKCCVLPPSTPLFSIGEARYPTKNKNFVAPGLSCKYIIKFLPKFYKDYEDKIRVNVSQGQTFDVKLLGKRTNSKLQLLSKWDCGDCFCHKEINAEFSIKNDEGKCRFWLYSGCVPKDKDGVNLFFEKEHEKLHKYNEWTIHLEDFTIHPTTFALGPGESQTFDVTFKPLEQGHFCEKLYILCDNLTILSKFYLVGHGIRANKHLLNLKCRWNFVRPHETWDVFAENFLNFDTVYAGNQESLSFTMKNHSSLPIKYHWEKFYPIFNPERLQRAQMEEPTLAIYPKLGELPGHQEQFVTLLYKPEKTSTLHTVIQVIAENIPRGAVDKSLKEIVIPTDDYNVVNVPLGFVDVQGRSIEYNLSISPPHLVIHGSLELGVTHRQLIQLVNYKRVPAYFKWNRSIYPNFIEIEPVVGFIGATYEMTMEVRITGLQIGKFVETLQCKIQGVKEPLSFSVAFRVCGNMVAIDTSHINLGLIRVGSEAEGFLIIRNTVSVKVPWLLIDSKEQSQSIELVVSPNRGELEPLASQKIRIDCKVKEVCSIRSTLELKVDGASQGSVGVFGEAILPKVCLQACTFFAGTVYRSIPFTTIVTLLNHSALCTTFCWDEAEGVDAKSCTILFEPTKGSIGPFESKAVSVTCTVNHMICFHDVCVPCWIDGMEEPLYWSVSGEVNGIEVFCSLGIDSRRYCATLREGGCEDEPHFDLDFGPEVPLGSVVVQEFQLTNNSAIRASFTITGTNFDCMSLDEWQTALQNDSKFPDYSLRKLHGILDKGLLSNKGFAFLVVPPIGWISAFNTEKIQIIAKSDMWGLYMAMLNVQVDEVKPIHMKISFNSVGLPFKFVAGSNYENIYKLRFGSYLIGGGKDSKKVKVVNSGPCDLFIEFETFIDSSHRKKQPKVVKVEFIKEDDIEYTNPHICSRCKPLPTIPELPIRVKLLQFNLIQYNGEINNKYFAIFPNPLQLSARSEAFITVFFMPPLFLSGSASDSVGCRCKGLVSIDRNLLSIANQVNRQHRRNVPNIVFDVTAHLTVPNLVFVPDDEDIEDAFTFTLNGGEFLFGKPDVICKKKILTFRNSCYAPMGVTFSVSSPFSISDWKKNDKPIFQTLKSPCENTNDDTKPISLDPGDIIKLTVQFTLSRHRVDKICHTAPCHTCEGLLCTQDCICHYCKEEYPHELFFKTSLKTKILNNQKEEMYPLIGHLFMPFIEVGSHELDFGICFVGQLTCQSIEILNPSACDSFYCIAYENCINEFRVEPLEGGVPARLSPEIPGRSELDIYFQPKCSKNYMQCIIVYGPFGIDPQRIVVKGTGSLDSKYKRDYDIVDCT